MNEGPLLFRSAPGTGPGRLTMDPNWTFSASESDPASHGGNIHPGWTEKRMSVGHKMHKKMCIGAHFFVHSPLPGSSFLEHDIS